MRATTRRAAAAGAALAAVSLALVLLAPAGAAGTADAANVSAYQGPHEGFEDAGAVKEAIDAGRLEPASSVVAGEALVVAVESERLVGALASRAGPSDERFFAVLDDTNATFRLLQTDAATHSPPKLARLGSSNVTVHWAGSTTYVVIDTAELGVRYAHADRHEFPPATLHGGERFAAEFGFDLPPPPESGSAVYEPTGPEFTLYHTAAEFSERPFRYEPLAPERFVRKVRVNVRPEDGLVVRLALADGQTLRAPVSVEEPPGAAPVWFDLRHVQPGTNYTLELVHDGAVVDRVAGTVRQPRADIGNVSVVQLENQSAVRLTAELSHGGTVRVRNAACEQVGWARLEPGNRTRLTVELWQPSGEPLRIEDPGNYSLLVRAVRERGATTPLYPGPAAVRLHAEGLDCDPPEPADPSGSASLHTPVAPATSSPAVITEPTTSSPGDGSPTGSPSTAAPSTGTPGQPGFSLLLTLAAMALAGLIARRLPDR